MNIGMNAKNPGRYRCLNYTIMTVYNKIVYEIF